MRRLNAAVGRVLARDSLLRFQALSTCLALTLVAAGLHAEPQMNAGFLAGIGGRGARPEYWQNTCFYGGARFDVILGRNDPSDFGLGPYAAITTAAFDDVRLGGGASFHLPVSETFPLVVSAGGFAKDGEAWEPGASLQVFLGPRSFNYHHPYVLAGGLVAGMDYSFGSSHETVFLVAAHIDAFVLALPFLIAYEALHGPDDD